MSYKQITQDKLLKIKVLLSFNEKSFNFKKVLILKSFNFKILKKF